MMGLMTSEPLPETTLPPRPPRTMRAWTTAGDGIEKITEHVVPTPIPQKGEVLVKISALSLNYRDLLVINGEGTWKPPRPIVPISDAVGIVVEVGQEVSRFRIGDRVSATFLPKWQEGPLTRETYVMPTGGPINRGMLAEYVSMDQDEAVATPHTLEDLEAAALPIAALTAWHAVARRSCVKPGQTVLIHGTGGVALFALQFALALGAIPIITSGSDEKLAKALTLGSAKTVNYKKTPDVASETLKLTLGEGVDHVFETIGGENLNLSLRALRIGGTISFIGLLAGLTANINTYEFVTKNVTIHGIETGSRQMYEEMAGFIDEHGLRPVVDSIFPVQNIREALKHLEGRNPFGKIVLTMPHSSATI